MSLRDSLPSSLRWTSSALLLLGALTSTGAHAAAANPVSAPTIATGDRWQYRVLDGWNQRVERERFEVRATGGATYERSGDRIAPETLRLAAPAQLSDGRINARAGGKFSPALDLLRFPLEPGKHWEQTVTRTDPATGVTRPVTVRARVLGWDTIRVPAGEFQALKIRRELYLGDTDTFRTETWRIEEEWYVPSLKAAARLEVWEQHRQFGITRSQQPNQYNRELYELVAFQPAGGAPSSLR